MMRFNFCQPLRVQTADSKRRGYLMIDLMIVMMLTISLLSMSSVLIHKTLIHTKRVQQRDGHTKTISRISRLIRADADRAIAMRIAAQTLELTLPEGRKIAYSINGTSLDRNESKPGQSDHKDRFLFAKNSKIQWEQGNAGHWIFLRIERDPSQYVIKQATQSGDLKTDAIIRIAVPSENQP